jgi:hypothetical protein
MNTVTTVAAEAAPAVAKVHPGRLASSLVIFAAGGDWTKRLVVLCDLVEAGRLPFLIWDAILFQQADTVGAAGRAVEGRLKCSTCDPAKGFLVMPPGVRRPPIALLAHDGRAGVTIRAGHTPTAIRP